MALTNPEKVDVRRYCGYSIYGDDIPTTFLYIYTVRYGILEQRMLFMSDDEVTILRDIYLTNLRKLESDLMLTTDNLDTSSAAVWKHNSNEALDRENLFTSWRMKLAAFLGVELMLASSGLRLNVA